MSVRIYVEGGGDTDELRARCREAFHMLIQRAGFKGRMPRIIAHGGREATFDLFRTAVVSRVGASYVVLLVDSEDPVSDSSADPDSPAAWDHLKARDGWERPSGVANDQAQLMVTCMETWIMADRQALLAVFGARLHTSALHPEQGLESRSRHDVQQALEHATRDCGRDKAYRKGRRSFQVLEQVNPAPLKTLLPHFERLLSTLDRHLP